MSILEKAKEKIQILSKLVVAGTLAGSQTTIKEAVEGFEKAFYGCYYEGYADGAIDMHSGKINVEEKNGVITMTNGDVGWSTEIPK